MKKKVRCETHNKKIRHHCASCNEPLCDYCETLAYSAGEVYCRKCRPIPPSDKREHNGSSGLMGLFVGIMHYVILYIIISWIIKLLF